MNYFMPISFVRRHARATLFSVALCTAGGSWTSAQSEDTNTNLAWSYFPRHRLQRAPRRAATRYAIWRFSKPGLYVDRIKFAPGMKAMPHWHPDSVRAVLVLSGTFYFAVGEQWDESQLKAYPAGTLYSEPARTPHYAWAKDGEVILQVMAIGPTDNTPIQQKSK